MLCTVHVMCVVYMQQYPPSTEGPSTSDVDDSPDELPTINKEKDLVSFLYACLFAYLNLVVYLPPRYQLIGLLFVVPFFPLT